MQHLRFLTRFDIQGTRMSCCYAPAASSSSAARAGSASSGVITGNCSSMGDLDCLPRFLEFDRSSVVPPPFDVAMSTSATGYYMKWVLLCLTCHDACSV